MMIEGENLMIEGNMHRVILKDSDTISSIKTKAVSPASNKTSEYWYRFEEDYCEQAHDFGTREKTVVGMLCLPVVKHTPCGVWLDMGYGVRKWVRKDSRKRYAHATIEEAVSSYHMRKTLHISHLRRRLRMVEDAIFYSRKLFSEI